MTRLLLTVVAFAAIQAQASTIDPAVARAGETLVGAVDYKGGFSKLELSVTIKDIVRSVRIGIPKFCKDVEVLQVGTLTEGIFDEADLASQKDQLYSINKGAGFRISGVRVTFNGPATANCSIPLFLSTKKAVVVNPGEETGKPIRLNLCNRSRHSASVMLGYVSEGEHVAKGWWNFARGQCDWLTVYGDPAGGLYLYGRTPSGSFWGKGPTTFCVKDTAFVGGAALCEKAEGGHAVPASLLSPAIDGNYYLDLL